MMILFKLLQILEGFGIALDAHALWSDIGRETKWGHEFDPTPQFWYQLNHGWYDMYFNYHYND